MDRAYNVTSDKIEYAYKLRELGKIYIEGSKYLCPNPFCRYPATPCSYQEHNIPQPYYRYLNGHNPGCCFSPDFGGKEVVDGKGKKQWVLPKVVEITLPKNDIEREKVSSLSLNGAIQSTKTKNTGKSNNNNNSHGKLSSSVAAATIFYMQDVTNNALEPLKLPEVTGKYRSVFQRICNWSTIDSYKPGYIFYADIRYISELIISNDEIRITLNVKEPESQKWFELKLCCSEWSNKERNAIIDELKRAKRFAEQTRDQSEVASIYFIGKQDKLNKSVFECDYAQFMYVYTGEYIELEKNYFGFNKKPEQNKQHVMSCSETPLETSSLVKEVENSTNIYIVPEQGLEMELDNAQDESMTDELLKKKFVEDKVEEQKEVVGSKTQIPQKKRITSLEPKEDFKSKDLNLWSKFKNFFRK